MLDKTKIYVFYSKDFREPTLLLSGEHAALEMLITKLEKAQREKVIKISLNSDPLFVFVSNIEVLLEINVNPCGMSVNSRNGKEIFSWSTSHRHLEEFIQRIKNVIASNIPCHAYLDTGALDSIDIIVSTGEYQFLSI